MMAHFFDLSSKLVGPIESVHARGPLAWGQRREPDRPPFVVEVEDLASVRLSIANGAVGNCLASWVRRKHEEVPSFQVDGEQGSLYFTFNRLFLQTQDETPLFRYDARAVQTDSLADWQSVRLEPRDPFEAQLELFLR